MDSFGSHLLPSNGGKRVKPVSANEMNLISLTVVRSIQKRNHVLARPDVGANIGADQSGFLSKFPVQGSEMIFARIESAAWQCPHLTGRKLEADEQDFVGWRQEQSPYSLTNPQAGGISRLSHWVCHSNCR